MTKPKFLFLFIAAIAAWNGAKAQSYSIRSFEGQYVKIHLTKTSKRWESAVSCLKDTLYLEDYGSIMEVHLLCHKFLEIVYDTRGGSGFWAQNTIILSVIEKKINVSLIVFSFGKLFGSDFDGSLYNIKFKIKGNYKSNYRLIANVYDRHNSDLHPKTSYIKYKHVILKFDSNQNIFYTSHKNIKHTFNINPDQMKHQERWEINEILPIINLGKDTRYYIKDKWYNCGDDSTLYEEYYRKHL